MHETEDPFSLLSNKVSGLLQDSKGRIWVGTCEGGVHLYDPQNDRFERMSANNSNPAGIYAPPWEKGPYGACAHVRTLYEDQWGGIWVGTFNGGLYRFDSDGSTPRRFKHDPTQSNSLANNMIWTFHEDSQGRFWLGNMDGGLHKIDPWKKKFQTHFSGKNISTILEPSSDSNTIWLAFWEEGIRIWDPRRQYLQNPKEFTTGSPNSSIFDFEEDGEQKIWMATDQGLYQYNPQSKRFRHFPIEEEKKLFLIEIYEDQVGSLWLGSFGSGLYRFDKNTEVVEKNSIAKNNWRRK